MSESDTTTFKRATGLAGKTLHGLSAAAIVFLYATFATTKDMQREIDMEHQRCIEAQAKQWRDMMDMLQHKLAVVDMTNSAVLVSAP